MNFDILGELPTLQDLEIVYEKNQILENLLIYSEVKVEIKRYGHYYKVEKPHNNFPFLVVGIRLHHKIEPVFGSIILILGSGKFRGGKTIQGNIARVKQYLRRIPQKSSKGMLKKNVEILKKFNMLNKK